MKRGYKSLLLSLFALGIAISGCSKKQSAVFSSLKDPATVAQLKRFVAEKKSQTNTSTNEAASVFALFFDAAERGDWITVSNTFHDFREHAGQYEGSRHVDPRLHGPQWQAVLEIWGAFEAFGEGNEKYSTAFGNDIIQSIPSGSIYFGGTDPGRFVVTAMQKSQVDGDPFFTLTQNALADGTYLEYARSMYGEKIQIPTAEDSTRCFQAYTDDAQKRLQNHQLKPGEDIKTGPDGHLQVSGQIAVMEINGLLVKTIFDKNTNQEFYIEESFPLDWMYPYLEPHQLIMKINRQPLTEISEDMAQADHDYWEKYIAPMIGEWLNSDTTVEEVTAFAEKTYVKHDLGGFKGDPRFVQSIDARKDFSKLRCSIGGVYAWRLGATPSGEPAPAEYTAKDGPVKQRMLREADFAFKQAFALCPSLPETVFRYAAFLTGQGQRSEAIQMVQTAMHADPGNQQFAELLNSLSR